MGEGGPGRGRLAHTHTRSHTLTHTPCTLRLPPAQALTNSKSYTVNYPIRHGLVDNWTNMERLWQRCFFDYLRCDPEEHYVMLVSVVRTPRGGVGEGSRRGAGRAGAVARLARRTTSASAAPHTPFCLRPSPSRRRSRR